MVYWQQSRLAFPFLLLLRIGGWHDASSSTSESNATDDVLIDRTETDSKNIFLLSLCSPFSRQYSILISYWHITSLKQLHSKARGHCSLDPQSGKSNSKNDKGTERATLRFAGVIGSMKKIKHTPLNISLNCRWLQKDRKYQTLMTAYRRIQTTPPWFIQAAPPLLLFLVVQRASTSLFALFYHDHTRPLPISQKRSMNLIKQYAVASRFNRWLIVCPIQLVMGWTVIVLE